MWNTYFAGYGHGSYFFKYAFQIKWKVMELLDYYYCNWLACLSISDIIKQRANKTNDKCWKCANFPSFCLITFIDWSVNIIYQFAYAMFSFHMIDTRQLFAPIPFVRLQLLWLVTLHWMHNYTCLLFILIDIDNGQCNCT